MLTLPFWVGKKLMTLPWIPQGPPPASKKWVIPYWEIGHKKKQTNKTIVKADSLPKPPNTDLSLQGNIKDAATIEHCFKGGEWGDYD